jgi:hypothetical protein
MQLKPTSIYLEEDVTKNIEFPVSGKFVGTHYGRFKCCGDLNPDVPNTNVEEPQFTTPFKQSQPWSLPRPWTNVAGPSLMSRKKVNTPYEAFLKRSIPNVALGLDQSGRNIVVENTINNVYIKIPENTVSAQSILSAMATRIGCEAVDLIILDVKFIEINDDKGKYITKNHSSQLFIQIWNIGKSPVEDFMSAIRRSTRM